MNHINECIHHNGTSQTFTRKTDGLGIRTSLCTHPTLWRPHRDHPDPKPTWWHSSSRSNAGMSTIHEKCVYRFTSKIHPDRLDMFAIMGALDKPTPMLCVIFQMTTLNHVLTRMENDTRLKPKSFDGTCKYVHRQAVWRKNHGQKPTWWHTSLRSNNGISTTMHINACNFHST